MVALGFEPWPSDSEPGPSTPALHCLRWAAKTPRITLMPLTRSLLDSQRILCVSDCHLSLWFPASAEFFLPSIPFYSFPPFSSIFIGVIHPHSSERQRQDLFCNESQQHPICLPLHFSRPRASCFYLIFCIILLFVSLSQNAMFVWLPLDFSILGIFHSLLTMGDTYSYSYSNYSSLPHCDSG